MPAIVTRAVRLRRPLEHVVVPDVEVDGPGVTLVTGRNGTGKSAFVELCSGYLRARSGSVQVLGVAADDPRVARARSVCRTTVALAPKASVRQHVRLFARASGADERAFLDRLAAFGPTPWIDAPASQLSSGMARLAWVVLTTTPRRALVLVDEPFLGLDAEAAAILHAELDDWARRSAVMVVDHSPNRVWSQQRGAIAMEPPPGTSPEERTP